MGNISLPLASQVNASNDAFAKLINSTGIYDKRKVDWYNKFSRYGCIDPYTSLQNSREYIFFTKPDLHIFENSNAVNLNSELSEVPLFADAKERYYNVLKQLQYSVNSSSNAFVNILSNTVKSALDLPGMNSLDVQTGENIYGTYLTYRKTQFTTDEQHEFSLEFEDSKYLEVYMWFRLYDEYCKLKDRGMVSPPDQSYILNKVLHDQMAIFKFIVGDDGETLIYWAKLWGVYPKSVPREAFSDLNNTSGLRFSVSFKSQFVDDMDPSILGDLNTITLANSSLPSTNDILPVYDKEIGRVNGEWAGLPFIVRNNTTSTNARYQLKWRR